MAKPVKMKSIERKIYFYKVTCACDGKSASLDSILDAFIKKLGNNNTNLIGRGLAIPYFDKYHFLDVKQHKTDKNVYRGQFYSLRSTDFPYLFNILDGNRQEITSNEDDTLMEQTHFYCYINKNLIVSEFNFHGARIERMGAYLSTIMQSLYPSKRFSIEILPIIIPDYYKKIINCKSISKIQFKVAEPGLKLLKEQGIINAYDIAAGNIEKGMPYYVDVEISGGKRGAEVPVNNTKAFLRKVIKAIKRAQQIEEGEDAIFRKAKMRGYDAEEYKTIPYDLLDEKLVRVAWVEKISPKTKYVDSNKMFSAISQAYKEKYDLALRYMGDDAE